MLERIEASENRVASFFQIPNRITDSENFPEDQ